jgi:hypothetical protein
MTWTVGSNCSETGRRPLCRSGGAGGCAGDQILRVPAPAMTVAFTVLLASGVQEYGIAATPAPFRTCLVPEFTL